MTDNTKGILAILVSAFGFVINDALIKLATAELPTGEIIVVRGLMATLIIGLATSWAMAWRPLSVLMQPAVAVRILASAGATTLIVAALRYLPLATTTAVLQLTPLAVTAGAALLLGATVGWQRWTASALGFAGVLFIVQPGGEGFVPEIWIALASLLFTSTRDLTTRFIDHRVPSLFITFWSSSAVMLAGFLLYPFEVWSWPSPHAWTLLIAASVAVYFAYYFGVVAMRIGEIAVVAPFRYSLVLLALLLSWGIWGHVPDLLSSLGIVVICGAGLYLLHRERVSKNEAAAQKEKIA